MRRDLITALDSGLPLLIAQENHQWLMSISNRNYCADSQSFIKQKLMCDPLQYNLNSKICNTAKKNPTNRQKRGRKCHSPNSLLIFQDSLQHPHTHTHTRIHTHSPTHTHTHAYSTLLLHLFYI